MDKEFNLLKERPGFVRHYSELKDDSIRGYLWAEEKFTFGGKLGTKLGLQRIAIHHETLLPGHRSSWPHAERLEEEFIFVLSGSAEAWIDGDIYPVKMGDCISFPAGTGIAHTFINNSNSNVELLFIGDQRMPGNQANWPLNPECQGIVSDEWWSDCPKKNLGDHDGLPDKVRSTKRYTNDHQ